ncbi:MAG TPA: DNA polymerase I [Clostridiales bacterium]|nr:DNA polymerase I [Clostridiales bacterium]
MNNFEFTDRLVLIDGNSLINRAFYALPPLTDDRGNYTHAVYGFTTMLIKAINQYKPKYMAVCFDLAHPTFRHLMYPEYKAKRKKMPADLASQIPVLKELLQCMDIKTVEKKGYEADDLIGAISRKCGCECVILTGDRDTLQLINDRTKVYLTKRGITEVIEIDEQELKNIYGLTPQQVIDFKALSGDPSDNIPGVAGIGEKTALRLITDYKSLDGIYQNIDQITGKLKEKLELGKQAAYLSYELAKIDDRAPYDFELSDFEYTYPFGECIKEQFEKLRFKSLLKKDIFQTEVQEAILNEISEEKAIAVIEIKTQDQLRQPKLDNGFSLVWDNDIHIAIDDKTEYKIILSDSLLGDGLPFDLAASYLKPYLENQNIEKTVFDYKNLRHYLDQKGINLRRVFDVALACYIVDGGVGVSSLKKLLDSYGRDQKAPAASLNIIRQKIQLELKNFEYLYYDIELPLSDVLYDMEKTGFKLDLTVLDELNQKYNSALKELTKKIHELAGENFNINSPKQLGEILYNKLNLTPVKTTKTKALSTDAESLEKLKGKHPIIDYILQYRAIAKLNSTYVEGLKKVADQDGVVHTEFRQTITSTGRLSSIEPNLQNIPIRDQEGKEIRRAFVARAGYKLVTADYSQIELRLLAHFSGEQKLIESYKNNEDIHTRTAAQVFGVLHEQVTPNMRRDAKAVNFGIIYGISDYGLAKGLGIPVSVANRYIKKYFETYPLVKEFMRKSVEAAKKSGEVTLASGRVRKIAELNSPNRAVRAFGERAAMNMPLQGTAADLIKIAMINVWQEFKKQGLKSRLILQVHDELIVEAKTEEIPQVVEILKSKMENAMKLNVPLKVDIGIGDNWYGI